MKFSPSFFIPFLLSATVLAQSRESTTAISSEAATLQPPGGARLPLPKPPTPKTSSPQAPAPTGPIDPLLDPTRPKNCQLMIENLQTVRCGPVEVVLQPGTYRQVGVVDGPQEKKATGFTSLKPQASGLGYIRYQSEEKIKVNGMDRKGGIDVGILSSDQLPLRIWYKKMDGMDDVTKAFSFILPPVALIAGAGAWSSGNILMPDSPPVFSEARDYFLKEVSDSSKPTSVEEKLLNIKPAEASRSGSFYVPGSAPSALRSR